MVAYAMIAFPEGPGYGPRYYYSGFLAIPLLGAKGFVLLLKRSTKRLLFPLLIGAVLVEAGIVIPYHSTWAYKVIYEQNDFERQVKQISPGPALVFLALEPDANADTRNTIDFRGNIVYARHRGKEDSLLMEAYPGRRYFLYEYAHDSKPGVLREITPHRAD